MAPRREFVLAEAVRRVLAVAVAGMFVLSGCSERGTPGTQATPSPPDPGALIAELTAAMSPDASYRDPDTSEASQARKGVRLLLAEPNNLAEHNKIFGDLGFSAFHGTDPVNGRPFSFFITLSSDKEAWGALLVDRSTRPRLVIEVPHPSFDINTEMLGIALHRRLPGSVLLVAGVHRAAAGGAADVAHNSKSLFHVLAAEFARNGLAQIQLHGFADKNFADAQIVVSTGAAAVTETARKLADSLQAAGLPTCRSWSARCGRLEGTQNEQGRAAADLDATFIHLEFGWSVRRDSDSRDLVVRTIGELLSTAGMR